MGWYKRSGKWKFKLPAGAVTCPDCEGHGTEQWECHVCDGSGTLKWRRAVALGYKKSYLAGLDSADDYCDCPRWECRCRDTCDTCAGDGYIATAVLEAEITRVLIFGITDSIPPRYRPNHHTGHLQANFSGEGVLSRWAGNECEKRRWCHISFDIFGHSLSLTDAGEAEAHKRMAEWIASHDVNWHPVDQDGRLADDGCPNDEASWDG
jgi:hypothetical protein